MGIEAKKVLRARGVSREYADAPVIAGIDFAILPGEIHVLLGADGAGKSTLFKCISGALRPTAGTITLGDDEIPYGDPAKCVEIGIAAIYQFDDLSQNLTVAQSIFLGHEPKRRGIFIDSQRMIDDSRLILRRIGHEELDPETLVGDLPVGKQRLVSVARAVAREACVLVVDEAVMTLGNADNDELFALMRRLAAEGVGIAYATSKSTDVARIGHRLTVIAGGRTIGADIPATTPVGDLEEMKKGHRVGEMFPPRPSATGDVVLTLKGLTRGDDVRNVSLELRAGEVLGVGGVVGAGRTELLRLIYGLDDRDAGEVIANGEEIPPMRPDRSIAAGVGLAPGEHRPQETMPAWTLTKNVSLADFTRFLHYALIASREDPEAADDRGDTSEMRALEGRIGDPDRALSALSGSNRQKVALARWLIRHCRVLLLDEPTENLDFDTRVQFYQVISELARLGLGVIFVSSNMRELAGFCTRIMIMRHGHVVAEVSGAGASEPDLLAAATQLGDQF